VPRVAGLGTVAAFLAAFAILTGQGALPEIADLGQALLQLGALAQQRGEGGA